MSKVQLTSQIELDFDEILKGVARLEPSELERFTEKVMALRAQRRAPSLPQNESELLQKINDGVPAEVRSQYELLHQKLLDETLTPDEQQTLIDLSDQIELADAERIRYLIDLAQLWGISVDALMARLGIRQPTYA